MSKLTQREEEQIRRTAIDGRVAFGAAALALAAGLVVLVERIGLPDRLVAVLGPLTVLASLAILGLLLRNMRVSSFYVAGRGVPVVYGGLAFAALAAALFAPFGRTLPSGLTLPALVAGFAGGCLVAGLLTGPLLRKTGALSITDMIIGRFPNGALRLGIVAIVGMVGALIGLAGLSAATQQIMHATGLTPLMALVIAAVVVAAIVEPGGLTGLLWAAAAAAGICLAGLGLPLVLAFFADGSLPLPAFSDRAGWDEALGHMRQWKVLPSAPAALDATELWTLVIGLGALAPILMPAMATSTRRAAQGAGLLGFAWFLAILLAGMGSLALATLALVHGVDGLRPEHLPNFLLEAAGRGDLSICGGHPGAPAAARTTCQALPGFSQTLTATQVSATNSYLLHAVSSLRGFGSAYAGLSAAGGIAVSLVLAAAGLQALGTALGHDLFYRVRASSALTSRRLAVTRLFMLVALIAGSILLHSATVDETALIGFAIALSAAAVMPLMLLSLWPRATSLHASIALILGLGVAEGVLFFKSGELSPATLSLAALSACATALVGGVIISFLQRSDPTGHGVAFVHAVMHGESDVLNPDKAA